jgi:hypothetical protein
LLFIRHGLGVHGFSRYGITHCGWLQQGAAAGTDAPIDDVRLVDQVSGVAHRVQAGSVPDRAVDVRDLPALSADEVMVVVAHARLVPGGASRGLYAAEEPSALQRVQRVIDGLQGHLAYAIAHTAMDGVHVEVVTLPYGPHDGQPGRGHSQSRPTESVGFFHSSNASIKPE